VQHLTRRDEIEVLGAADLQANPNAFLTAPRPPVLKDYFDEKLLTRGNVLRKDRHVQIGLNVNPIDLPASTVRLAGHGGSR
jgi:hypothetical protein